MKSARLKVALHPGIERELHSTALLEGRTIAAMGAVLIKEALDNRRKADASIDRLVAAIKGVAAEAKPA